MVEEREKKLKREVTDTNILDGIGEMNNKAGTSNRSRSGIVVKGIHDIAVRFSRCLARFLEMRSLDLLPGAEGFRFTGRTVSIC